MMRKDVTPQKKKQSKFLSGLLGGIIGGLLAFGLAFAVIKPNSTANTSTSSEPNKPTEVSKVTYDVESGTIKAVEKVQDAVVSVVNLQKRQKMEDIYGGLGSLFGRSEQQEDNSEQKSSDEDLKASSEGSGVIYKKEGNKAYIVTNNHVVEGSDGLEVLLDDGTKLAAKLVGTDAYTDLAVIEVDSSKVKKTADFGDSDKIKVGEPAIAIGSPLGSIYANSVTQGIISAKNRNIVNRTDNNQVTNINALQTDAAINPGNSGGPLVNIAGQVIGINSIKIAQAESGVSAEGLGFAIPSNDVITVINQLEKNGKVIRPALGITMSDLSLVSAEQQEKILKLPKNITTGVIIREVRAATPADRAGLKQYDVIVGIDDQKVETSTDLQTALYKKKVGDKAKITFYRGKDKKSVTVDLVIEQSATK